MILGFALAVVALLGLLAASGVRTLRARRVSPLVPLSADERLLAQLRSPAGLLETWTGGVIAWPRADLYLTDKRVVIARSGIAGARNTVSSAYVEHLGSATASARLPYEWAIAGLIVLPFCAPLGVLLVAYAFAAETSIVQFVSAGGTVRARIDDCRSYAARWSSFTSLVQRLALSDRRDTGLGGDIPPGALDDEGEARGRIGRAGVVVVVVVAAAACLQRLLPGDYSMLSPFFLGLAVGLPGGVAIIRGPAAGFFAGVASLAMYIAMVTPFPLLGKAAAVPGLGIDAAFVDAAPLVLVNGLTSALVGFAAGFFERESPLRRIGGLATIFFALGIGLIERTTISQMNVWAAVVLAAGVAGVCATFIARVKTEY